MAGSSPNSCSLQLLLLLVVATALSLLYPAKAGSPSHHLNLTAGFTRVNLSESQFVVQKPYNVPLNERYEQSGGVRRLWVFNTDKPITPNHGAARTEIKVNKIYNSGVWQFEGDMFVPNGTSGVSVMQIFGAATHATTLMLRVYDGQLTYYHQLTKVVVDHVYDRWLRLNVIHDVAAAHVTVFIDGEKKLEALGQGGNDHYFKFGVYKQPHPISSYRMESRWKNVAIYTKP